MSSGKSAPTLAELRREIDRIDEAMHDLLMQRGDIIDRLISVKKTQEVGSAFRPAREADMMRHLCSQHAEPEGLMDVHGPGRLARRTAGHF